MKRFVEIYDDNQIPVFEGDKCRIQVEEQTYGGASRLGNLARNFGVDRIDVEFLCNEPYLETVIEMKFFKDNEQIITNKDFYLYQNQDISKFDDVNMEEMYILKTNEPLFIRYLTSYNLINTTQNPQETLEKVLDSDLIIKIQDREFKVNDTIMLLPSKSLKEKINDIIKKNDLFGDFTHIKIELTRSANSLSFENKVFLSNKKGEITVMIDKNDLSPFPLMMGMDLETITGSITNLIENSDKMTVISSNI